MKKLLYVSFSLFCFFFLKEDVLAQDTCQLIIPEISSYSPSLINNKITVCRDNTASVTGSATFSVSGNGAEYKWNFGDSQDTIIGQSATHVYTNPGIYVVVLKVTDANGCIGIKTMAAYVPDNPNFAGTDISVDTICAGEPFTMVGMAEPTEIRKICTTPEADVTFMPDGSGVSYSTSVPVTCFNTGQTMTSAADITSVCINMEHSYSGDLDIQLACPDGTEIYLKDGGGGGTILGEPVATDLPVDGSSATLLDPGIGYTYCFSPTSTNGFITDPGNWTNVGPYTDPLGNVSTGTINQVNPGTYQAVGDWDDLIGCPLNGAWTITITDNIGADNGYIFFWSIDFAPEINTSDSFTPSIIKTEWLDDATMTSNSGNYATAVCQESGLKCYTFRATDTFNCPYDTSVCVYIRSRPIEEFSGEICPGESFMGFNTPGEHRDTLVAANGCDSIRIINVKVNPFPSVTTFPERNANLCQGDSTLLTVYATENAQYQWIKDGYPIQDATNRDFMAKEGGVYKVAAISDKECADTSANIRVVVNPAAEAEILGFSREDVCFDDTVSVMAKMFDNYQYRWSPEKYFRHDASYLYANAQLKVEEWKQPIYLMVMNEYGCQDFDTAVITGHPCCDLTLPTVFSPNGDGLNDYFKPILRDYQKIVSLRIFDRYGKEVYVNKSNDSRGWDGKYPDGRDAILDTYMYMIEYTCTDGEIYTEKGDVILVK